MAFSWSPWVEEIRKKKKQSCPEYQNGKRQLCAGCAVGRQPTICLLYIFVNMGASRRCCKYMARPGTSRRLSTCVDCTFKSLVRATVGSQTPFLCLSLLSDPPGHLSSPGLLLFFLNRLTSEVFVSSLIRYFAHLPFQILSLLKYPRAH